MWTTDGRKGETRSSPFLTVFTYQLHPFRGPQRHSKYPQASCCCPECHSANKLKGEYFKATRSLKRAILAIKETKSISATDKMNLRISSFHLHDR